MGDKIIGIVFGPDYLPAHNPLSYLCIGYYFLGLTYPFVPLISALEKNKLLLIVGIFGLYNLAMDIVLVPHMGVSGAAIATATANILHLLLYWIVFRRRFHINITFPVAALAKTAINMAPAVILIVVMKSWICDWISLLLALAVIAASYVIPAFWNHIFDDREAGMIKRLAAQRS
jgi:O-antigen/teichoic acid export membrane protein